MKCLFCDVDDMTELSVDHLQSDHPRIAEVALGDFLADIIRFKLFGRFQ